MPLVRYQHKTAASFTAFAGHGRGLRLLSRGWDDPSAPPPPPKGRVGTRSGLFTSRKAGGAQLILWVVYAPSEPLTTTIVSISRYTPATNHPLKSSISAVVLCPFSPVLPVRRRQVPVHKFYVPQLLDASLRCVVWQRYNVLPGARTPVVVLTSLSWQAWILAFSCMLQARHVTAYLQSSAQAQARGGEQTQAQGQGPQARLPQHLEAAAAPPPPVQGQAACAAEASLGKDGSTVGGESTEAGDGGRSRRASMGAAPQILKLWARAGEQCGGTQLGLQGLNKQEASQVDLHMNGHPMRCVARIRFVDGAALRRRDSGEPRGYVSRSLGCNSTRLQRYGPHHRARLGAATRWGQPSTVGAAQLYRPPRSPPTNHDRSRAAAPACLRPPFRLATQAQCARGLRPPIAQPRVRLAVIMCVGMLFTPLGTNPRQ